jgi:hypothetical protein
MKCSTHSMEVRIARGDLCVQLAVWLNPAGFPPLPMIQWESLDQRPRLIWAFTSPPPGRVSSLELRNGTRKVVGVTYQRYVCLPITMTRPTLKSYASGNVAPVRRARTVAEVAQARAESNLPSVMSKKTGPNLRTLLNDRW